MKKNILKKTQIYHILLWGLFLVAGLQVALSFTGAGSIIPPNAVTAVDLPLMSTLTSQTQILKGPFALSPGGMNVIGLTTLSKPPKITAGTPGLGKVMISDADGNGHWAALGVNTDDDGCRRSTTPGTYGAWATGKNTKEYWTPASHSTMIGPNGIWTDPSHVRTVSATPGSCLYTYKNSGSGDTNLMFCDGVDERLSKIDVGKGENHECNNYGVNGTNAKEGDSNGGSPGCYTLCKEVNFTYQPKSAADCTAGYGIVGQGHYTGIAKSIVDPKISSGPITMCDMLYHAPWSCKPNTSTYTYSGPNYATEKCTRTTVSNGNSVQVDAIAPKGVARCPTEAAAGWVTYRRTGDCIGGIIQ